MEECPNCKKKAVDKDQCLACGIIVSRWLKLHSVIPPDRTDRDENQKAIYPHVPPTIEMKKDRSGENNAEAGIDKDKLASNGHREAISGLQPPAFITEEDATIPLQESMKSGEMPQIHPWVPRASVIKQPHFRQGSEPPTPSAKQIGMPSSDAKERSNQPAFFAKTEEDMIKLKKNLKTDWEEYYASRKDRYKSSENEINIATRFKVRNMLISVPLLVISFFAADISFLMRFGVTAEYSALQPLITVIALISFFLALTSLFTLKPPVAKKTDSDNKKLKLGMNPVHIVELSLMLLLIVLMPFKPVFIVDSKSEFPMLSDSDMKSEFLTGEGLGNFIRPIFGRDGKTIYAIHLYGNSTGFLVTLTGDGSYKLVFDGAKISKYRFIGKEKIVYLESEGLHLVSLTGSGNTGEADSVFQQSRILSGYSPSDFDLSSDGRNILFCHEGDIWISADPFTSAENITKSPANIDVMPSFFPDNNGFLYISDIIPIVSGDASLSVDTQEMYDEMAVGDLLKIAHCYQLFAYHFNDGKVVRVIEDENNYYYPLYSPNMSRIAVVTEVKSNPTVQSGPLYMAERAVVLMRPDGSGKVRVFPPLEMPLRAMHEMCWSQDGKQLLLGINALLQKGIYRLSF